MFYFFYAWSNILSRWMGSSRIIDQITSIIFIICFIIMILLSMMSFILFLLRLFALPFFKTSNSYNWWNFWYMRTEYITDVFVTPFGWLPINSEVFINSMASIIMFVCMIFMNNDDKYNEVAISIIIYITMLRLFWNVIVSLANWNIWSKNRTILRKRNMTMTEIFLYTKPKCDELDDIIYSNLDEELMNKMIVNNEIVQAPLDVYVKHIATSKNLDPNRALLTYSFIHNLNMPHIYSYSRNRFINSYPSTFFGRTHLISLVKSAASPLLTTFVYDELVVNIKNAMNRLGVNADLSVVCNVDHMKRLQTKINKSNELIADLVKMLKDDSKSQFFTTILVDMFFIAQFIYYVLAANHDSKFSFDINPAFI